MSAYKLCGEIEPRLQLSSRLPMLLSHRVLRHEESMGFPRCPPSRFGPCISLWTPALAKLSGVSGLALSQRRCPSRTDTCRMDRLDFDESPGYCQALTTHHCLRCADVRWDLGLMKAAPLLSMVFCQLYSFLLQINPPFFCSFIAYLSISSTIWSSQGRPPSSRLPLGEALQSRKQNPVRFSEANNLVEVFTTRNSHHTPEEELQMGELTGRPAGPDMLPWGHSP